MTRLIVLVALGLFGTSAEAHTKKPCAKDIKKYCKDVRGDDAVLTCLKENKDKLSEKCKKTHDIAGEEKSENGEHHR